MMPELSAQGKIFLLGEYYVTQPGEAYVITLDPQFHLQYEKGLFEINNIHPNSPAGKFIADHMLFFADYKLTFIDPYNQIGGFGASTAQFLLAYQLRYKNTEFAALIDCYLRYAWNGQGVIPSGADLLAQATGSSCYVNKINLEVTPITWPFPNLRFHIIHTNNKLTTHTHLANLQQLDTSLLNAIFQTAKAALAANDAAGLCNAINQYQQALMQLNLTAENTIELIKKLKAYPEVLAAKGCGAMGADTLLLITENGQTEFVKTLCENLNLKYIYLF